MVNTNDRKDKLPKLSARGEAALALTRLGWPVLPLHWAMRGKPACSCGANDCKVGKHPFGRHGFAPKGLHDCQCSLESAGIRTTRAWKWAGMA